MAKKSTPWSVEEVTTFLHCIADDKVQRELDGTTRNIEVFREVSTLMSCYSRTVVQCREKLKKMKSKYRLVKDNNNTSGASRKNWKWFDLMDTIYGHRPASVGREGGLDSATTLLESLHDDYIGTSEEEQFRTTSSASTSSTSTAQTPARPQTPTQTPTRAQTPTPSASSTPLRVVLGKRKRGGEDLALQERQLAQQKEHQEQNLAEQREDRAQQKEDQAQQKEDRALRAQHMNQTLVEAREARLLEAALRREEIAHAESFNVSFLRTLCQVLGGTGSQRAPSPPPL
ncbi:epsin-2-like [Trematomus bernacchii]|uniref:epsin-2-like n=1 Tax=Trematomus bernacchii TaxID=40690 RepID=UPI00146D3A7A|nr:epsin-2-like [Trematomus bernacchii]